MKNLINSSDVKENNEQKENDKNLNQSSNSDQRVKELLDYLEKKCNYEELYVKVNETTVKIKKQSQTANDNSLSYDHENKNLKHSSQNSIRADIKENILIEEKNINDFEVKAPIIGTYYKSANPGGDPFVKEGDIVKKGQTLCIIEAMKLFNEIESEKEGKIKKILMKDATPVEYNQPLFIIECS